MVGRRNRAGKAWRAKVARVAKTVTLKNSETKRYVISGENNTSGGAAAIVPLFSNGGSTSLSSGPFVDSPLKYIDQNDGITGRTGNRITLKGIHAHVQIENDENLLGNTHVRIAFMWIDPNQTLSSITFANLYMGNALVANTTTNAFFRKDSDTDSIIRRVVYDRVFSLSVGNAAATGGTITNQVGQRLIRINLPLHNKVFQYINSGSGSQGETEDLIMVMTAYTPGRTGANQVANVKMYRKVYYKDP